MSWIEVENREISLAVNGNSQALMQIIESSKEPIYNLALKFLWHPQDAEDASQEILIKVITNLSGFRQASLFGTWVYRIAVNHLLKAKKSRAERAELSFREISPSTRTLSEDPLEEHEQNLILDVKTACLYGMTLGLSRKYRMTFLLGTALGMTGEQAAQILAITPQAYRQRLSRANRMMAAFLNKNCGLVNESAACRCAKRTKLTVSAKSFKPYLQLAGQMKRTGIFNETANNFGRDLTAIERAAVVYRRSAKYAMPTNLEKSIQRIIKSGLFNEN